MRSTPFIILELANIFGQYHIFEKIEYTVAKYAYIYRNLPRLFDIIGIYKRMGRNLFTLYTYIRQYFKRKQSKFYKKIETSV